MACTIEKLKFGSSKEGKEVSLFVLENNGGMRVSICNYGGIITSLKVPDRNEEMGEIVLGFDSFEDYLKPHPYFGTVIGRVANRISGASFVLNDKTYLLHKNDGNNHLHGGLKALDKVLWQAEIIKEDHTASLSLSYLSKDGEENYPGNLECKIIFTLFEENKLDIEYKAICDKPSVVNFTHHDYFNLKDGGVSPIMDHELMINAEMYTPVREDLCVTGEIKHVNDSDFDFRQFSHLKEKITIRDQHATHRRGYDQNFILNNMEDNLGLAAILREASKGRQLIIKTTQPCLQLYTGTYLDGQYSRSGSPFHAYHGLCLECQSYPDAINQSHFPSIILNPGEAYYHKTSLRFSVYT